MIYLHFQTAKPRIEMKDDIQTVMQIKSSHPADVLTQRETYHRIWPIAFWHNAVIWDKTRLSIVGKNMIISKFIYRLQFDSCQLIA